MKQKALDFILAVLAEEDTARYREDEERVLRLLNDLYHSVTPEQYEQFVGIVNAANDSEQRCPK